MKNLEVKVEVTNSQLKGLEEILANYFKCILTQTDTYYCTETGRLKLREEKTDGKYHAYAIYYERPDLESRYSEYFTYEIVDVDNFKRVFSNGLKTELVIEKERRLYLYENARIHLDKVKHLGSFVEIEVVINNDEEMNNSKQLMETLKNKINIAQLDHICCGYRELIIKNTNATHDLTYYER